MRGFDQATTAERWAQTSNPRIFAEEYAVGDKATNYPFMPEGYGQDMSGV